MSKQKATLGRNESCFRSARALGFTVLAIAASWVEASAARADSCVEVDTERDNLEEADRAAARTLLVRTFENQGQAIVPSPCPTTYRVYHVKLASGIDVVLTGPNGTRTQHVAAVEEIGNAYGPMVQSLLAGAPPATSTTTMSPTAVAPSPSLPALAPPPAPVPMPASPVASSSSAPEPSAAPPEPDFDSVFYGRFGYGAVFGRDTKTGPTFGFGYRYESGHLGLDATLFNFVLTKGGQSFDSLTGSWIRFGALVYLDGDRQSSTPYAGASIGWGLGNVKVDGTPYTNNGLDFDFTVGFEALRANPVRLFLQLDATLPAYSAEATLLRSNGTATIATRDFVRTPSVALTIGVGFSKPKGGDDSAPTPRTQRTQIAPP